MDVDRDVPDSWDIEYNEEDAHGGGAHDFDETEHADGDFFPDDGGRHTEAAEEVARLCRQAISTGQVPSSYQIGDMLSDYGLHDSVRGGASARPRPPWEQNHGRFWDEQWQCWMYEGHDYAPPDEWGPTDSQCELMEADAQHDPFESYRCDLSGLSYDDSLGGSSPSYGRRGNRNRRPLPYRPSPIAHSVYQSS